MDYSKSSCLGDTLNLQTYLKDRYGVEIEEKPVMDFITGIKRLQKKKIPFIPVQRKVQQMSILSSLLVFQESKALLFKNYDPSHYDLKGYKIEIPYSKTGLEFLRAVQLKNITYVFHLNLIHSRDNSLLWRTGMRVCVLDRKVLKDTEFCVLDMIKYKDNWLGFNVQENLNVPYNVLDDLEIKKIFHKELENGK